MPDQEANGHGKLQELADERDFFDAGKKSEKIVCHFFMPTNKKCEVVDYCLEKLAMAHFGTRFVKINAERVPYLTNKLRISHVPNLCVILDNKITNYLRITDETASDKDQLLNHVEKWIFNQRAIEKLVLTKDTK
uniref:Thioredoxin domain-containing protein n=1 Tax=Panagrolaimus sp. JU765 TaxID=591449 RepID=A0AC34R3P7_9BILA